MNVTGETSRRMVIGKQKKEKSTCARYPNPTQFAAKDFIRSLLTLDPEQRPTATSALKDKWMTGQDATDIDILDTVRENFNPRRTLKNAVRAVSAMNRLRSGSALGKSPANGDESEKQDAPPALAAVLKAAAAKQKNASPA